MRAVTTFDKLCRNKTNLVHGQRGRGSGAVRFFYGTRIKIDCPPLPCSERHKNKSQVKSRGLIEDVQNHPERFSMHTGQCSSNKATAAAHLQCV